MNRVAMTLVMVVELVTGAWIEQNGVSENLAYFVCGIVFVLAIESVVRLVSAAARRFLARPAVVHTIS